MPISSLNQGQRHREIHPSRNARILCIRTAQVSSAHLTSFLVLTPFFLLTFPVQMHCLLSSAIHGLRHRLAFS